MQLLSDPTGRGAYDYPPDPLLPSTYRSRCLCCLEVSQISIIDLWSLQNIQVILKITFAAPLSSKLLITLVMLVQYLYDIFMSSFIVIQRFNRGFDVHWRKF